MSLTFKSRVVADPAAQLNFEQLAGLFGSSTGKVVQSANALTLVYGTGTLTWAGGNNASNTFTQAHGLASTPAVYGAWANGTAPGGVDFYLYSRQAADATNIYLVARGNAGQTPVAGLGGPFIWWAIG